MICNQMSCSLRTKAVRVDVVTLLMVGPLVLGNLVEAFCDTYDL